MQKEQNERRHFKRIFFSMKEGPSAVFNFSGNYRKTVTAIVMDLSIGGLGLSIKKDEELIKVGDHLRLTGIKGIKYLESVADIETEIKWLRNYESFQHILFGCEFLYISDTCREDIQRFIDLWAVRV